MNTLLAIMTGLALLYGTVKYENDTVAVGEVIEVRSTVNCGVVTTMTTGDFGQFSAFVPEGTYIIMPLNETATPSMQIVETKDNCTMNIIK